ncbi:hypothetical protein PM082_007338 [Marasmius tenuissimus]|nr:hypothetical protein PM082_007338 [Marasmius tenuissimus]
MWRLQTNHRSHLRALSESVLSEKVAPVNRLRTSTGTRAIVSRTLKIKVMLSRSWYTIVESSKDDHNTSTYPGFPPFLTQWLTKRPNQIRADRSPLDWRMLFSNGVARRQPQQAHTTNLDQQSSQLSFFHVNPCPFRIPRCRGSAGTQRKSLSFSTSWKAHIVS